MYPILKFRSRHLVALGLMILGVIGAIPAHAQPITQATIVEILDGDQVYIENRKVREQAVAKSGEQVRTQQARAGLRFNIGAGIRLGRNSSVVVGGGCIRLNRGTVLVSGATAGNRGCLRSVVAATRGTVYIMELEDGGQGRITVLEGAIEVSNSERPEIQQVAVAAGQAVDTAISGDFGAPFQVPQDQLNKVAAPLLEGFQQSLPDLQKISIAQRDSGFASTFLQEAIGGGDSGFERSFDARSFDAQRGVQSVNFLSVGSFPGTFVRLTNQAGVFNAAAGFSLPVTVNFANQTIAIGGFNGVTSSLGLSGNNAVGTVILNNGQAVRVEVFNVEFEEPRRNRPYPGSLSIGQIRDR